MKIEKLGPYIKEIDVRNTECKQTNLLGVSVSKTFIQSIANTVGTDWTKYKVIKKLANKGGYIGLYSECRLAVRILPECTAYPPVEQVIYAG